MDETFQNLFSGDDISLDEKIKTVANLLKLFASKMILAGIEENNPDVMTKSNILRLISVVLEGPSEDARELEAFLGYYSAKKVMDSTSISELMMQELMKGGVSDILDKLKNSGDIFDGLNLPNDDDPDNKD